MLIKDCGSKTVLHVYKSDKRAYLECPIYVSGILNNA